MLNSTTRRSLENSQRIAALDDNEEGVIFLNKECTRYVELRKNSSPKIKEMKTVQGGEN